MTDPAMTVVVPVRDRPAELRQLLESVGTSLDCARRAGHAAEVKVLVVDDRSCVTPSLPQGLPARVISSDLYGPGAARNTGALRADTEWLLFTDSDCVVEPAWISRALQQTEVGSFAVVQGDPTRYTAATELGATEEALYAHMYSAYLDPGRRTTKMLDSRNLLIKKHCLLSAGGFPTTGQDAMADSRILAANLTSAGVEFSYDEEMIVKHRAPTSIEGEMRAKFRHGRGRRGIWGHTPPTDAELAARYFVNPVRSGIAASYVIPVHVAFLAGYSVEVGLPADAVPARALRQAGSLNKELMTRALAWLTYGIAS